MNKYTQDLKALDKIEEEWNNKLNKEMKEEEEILSIIDNITSNLLISKRIKSQINDKTFVIAYSTIELPIKYYDSKSKTNKTRKVMHNVLTVIDIDKYKIAQGRYIPLTSKCEYDTTHDLKANIRVVVEGWIRHITGTIKPEMLED